MRKLLLWTTLLCSLALSACGFQMRGSQVLPFSSIYLELPPSEFATNFKRVLKANGSLTVNDSPTNVEAIFKQVAENREKNILAINSAGRVSEFELRYSYTFRIVDPAGNELIPPTPIVLRRDFTFNDSIVLAKEQEEELLWRDMQSDLVQQIMRRLAATKVKKPVAPAQ